VGGTLTITWLKPTLKWLKKAGSLRLGQDPKQPIIFYGPFGDRSNKKHKKTAYKFGMDFAILKTIFRSMQLGCAAGLSS